jgi:hypothetical protein
MKIVSICVPVLLWERVIVASSTLLCGTSSHSRRDQFVRHFQIQNRREER